MLPLVTMFPGISALVLYVSTPSTFEGAVIPAAISIVLAWRYGRGIQDRKLVLGFWATTVLFGLLSEYWGTMGLHVFTGSLIIWPILSLLSGDRLPWPMTYPLAYTAVLIPDAYGAGSSVEWTSGWFFGVGGAGFRDGLFVIPLESMVFSAILNNLGNRLRKHGLFDRRSAQGISNCAESEERRAGRKH